MKIVIIEDERLTAKDLANSIRSVEPDAEILPLLFSIEEAISFFKQKPDVDLIFSDIELGDGLSFDIFKTIELQAPVIFCTAYEKYTLDAFKTLGIDYILKPFTKSSIEKAIIKYKTLKDKFVKPTQVFDELLFALKNNHNKTVHSLIVQQGEKIIPINANDIALFYYEDNYSFAYTFSQKKIHINYKMEALEKMFFPIFFRANRQYLVNRKTVKDASHYFSRKVVVNLNIPYPGQIIVGKLKTTAFFNWLAGN
jgi:DNA-binding LytR/AlgR family response regulator